MRKQIPILALIFVLSGMLIPQLDAAAQGGLTMEARAGFDGYYRVNSWVPVQVIVANEGKDIKGQLQLAVQDSRSAWVVYTQPAILPTYSRKQFTLYAFIENYTRELSVRLVQGGKELAEQTVSIQPLGAEAFLVGVVSDDTSALNYLAGLPPVGQTRIHVAHLRLSDIPVQGRILGSIDALILHSTDTSQMSQGQRDALRSWVALGGHLIICGGPNAQLTAAGLGDLLPVTIAGTVTTADIGTLGDLANAPFIVSVPAVVAQVELNTGNGYPAASSACSTGCVLAGKSDLPLLVRRDLDRGSIDYLALDPDLEPMRTWIGNDSLWPKLFSCSTVLLSASGEASDCLAMGRDVSGILNVGLQGTSASRTPWIPPGAQGNINDALANIPGLDVPPVLLVMAFLFIYVVVVGPLNFLVLKLVDRRALAWITVPAIILLFSCMVYVAGLAFRGRKVIISEITIVQTLPESGVAVVDSFAGLYSPVRSTYDIRLPGHVLVHRAPGRYYGPGGGTSKTLKVEQGTPTYVRQLEVDVGAMSDFAVHATQRWQGIDARLTLSRTVVAGRSGSAYGTYPTTIYHAEGTISNQSDVDIRDCALVFDSTAIRIADLAAGTTEAISVDFQPSGTSYGNTLIDTLVGASPAIGADTPRPAREWDRRRMLLNGLFSPYIYGPTPNRTPLRGMMLVGWLDKSLTPIDVERVSAQVNATTLLIAPLPISGATRGLRREGSAERLPTDSDAVIVPRGFVPWQLVDGEPETTPYALYRHQAAPTFRFHLPGLQLPRLERDEGSPLGTQDAVIEKLILHVDSVNPPAGPPPVISFKDVTGDQWVSFSNLTWGENEIPDPHRFIRAPGERSLSGSIEIMVSTNTIVDQSVSVDFSVIGRRK